MKKSITAFASKFFVSSPDVAARKSSRFTRFLANTTGGRLFERPKTKPSYVAYMDYHPPMPYVLQSSYEDVEAELNILRGRHLDKLILFVGGDGLSINRVNWLLNMHVDLYLEQSPLIVPRMGEAPHGVFHVMHAGWRLYVRLIRLCADELNNKQIVDDPSVKQFNVSLHFLWRITRAISEYFIHLSRSPGGPDLDMLDEFQRAANLNSDFAWLFHFVYDFAYLVLDFKQSVRSCDGDALDLLWREFFALGHCSSANKTQYVPMAIMRIFWAECAHPDLVALYQSTRSVPMSDREGAMVGHDCPVEWLNGAITSGVDSHVSIERIEKFIVGYPLLQHNHHIMREWSMSARARYDAFMKELDGDVNALKAMFMEKVGADWQSVCRRSTWQNSQPPAAQLIDAKHSKPWEEVNRVMTRTGSDSVTHFIAKTVRKLTCNYYVWER